MVNNREVVLSCEIFSGFKTIVDLDESNDLQGVVQATIVNLDAYLESGNLYILKNMLKNMHFHIHGFTFEDMLLKEDSVFHVCSHSDDDKS